MSVTAEGTNVYSVKTVYIKLKNIINTNIGWINNEGVN